MITFNLIDKQVQFFLEKDRNYSIYFVGGYSVRNSGKFNARLYNIKTEQSIDLIEPLFKIRKLFNWKRTVTYYKFNVEESGEYTIVFNNINDLIIKKSRLLIK